MPATNRLLEALSPAAKRDILAVARQVALPQGSFLTKADEPIGSVYFLTGGVGSFVVSVKDGLSAEVGMIGNEGVVGSGDLTGLSAPVTQCVMQMSGQGYRVPVQDMRRLFEESVEVRYLLLQSMQEQLLTSIQIAACNRLHKASERLARWLLTAADRSNQNCMSLTQEALAQILGTRRTTVALVAGTLQRSHLIRYRRGNVHIMDREGLTKAACTCYGINKQMMATLYTNPYFTP